MKLKNCVQAIRQHEEQLKRKLTWIETLAFKAGFESRDEDLDVLMTKIGLLKRMIPSDMDISTSSDKEC